MKKAIFDKYITEICKLYRFADESEIWSKSKRRDYANARYLLFFLAVRRGINKREVQRYAAEYGWLVARSNVIHAVRTMQQLMDTDVDYSSIIRRIETATTI